MPALAAILIAPPRGVGVASELCLTCWSALQIRAIEMHRGLTLDPVETVLKQNFVCWLREHWLLESFCCQVTGGPFVYGICCPGRNIVWGSEFKEI